MLSSSDSRSVVVNYVMRNLRTHNFYVYKFIFCEFLNLVNIIGQMYLMDDFFGGQFTTYGAEVNDTEELNTSALHTAHTTSYLHTTRI